ncbi:MAG: LysR family transcriptional regulator [Neisseriaceae bacterium]|nr:LysR family transcriptional regulator [Neisseriaceae bacterium]
MLNEPPIDLKQLKYFTHVAEMGSFTKAAHFLNIAQPILSRQIRRLEVDLHQNLLIRNGRGVTLTDAGKVLLEHSRGILHQVERAYEEVTQGQLSGRVTIGLPPTMAKLLSVPLTRAFRQQLPHANLIIMEGLTAVIEEGLLTGRLDMGLLHNPAFSPDLEISLLAKDNLCLIARADDVALQGKQSFELKDIASLPLILPSHPNTYRMLVEIEMAKIGCKPNTILEMNSVGTILDLVCEGMGYAILSQKTLALVADPTTLVAYPITSPQLVNKLFMATSNKRIMTQTQKTMYAIIETLCVTPPETVL